MQHSTSFKEEILDLLDRRNDLKINLNPRPSAVSFVNNGNNATIRVNESTYHDMHFLRCEQSVFTLNKLLLMIPFLTNNLSFGKSLFKRWLPHNCKNADRFTKKHFS
jgi:hypothetical protein